MGRQFSTGVHSIPFIREAQEGMKLVVIDPRTTRTTMMVDIRYCIRPGTDAFSDAMIKVIVDNNLHDVDLNDQTHGWEEFVNDILPKYTLEEAERITGVKEEEDLAIVYKN